MFDTIAGLPLHALVVHAVVVLVPLTVIGVVVMAMSPRLNRRYGWIVVWLAAVSAGSAFVALESGEVLASRVGTPQDHYAVARWIPWVGAGLFVVTAALWWMDRVRLGGGEAARSPRGPGAKAYAVLAAVLAVAALGMTVRAGDTGARAVWEPTVQNTTPGTQPVP